MNKFDLLIEEATPLGITYAYLDHYVEPHQLKYKDYTWTRAEGDAITRLLANLIRKVKAGEL